ncbi:hypothetical protein HQ393_06265 [Chitinibacter bivalviorum]|uniref:Uncharacterized protein n=1 Tax=Chitinibacter bivalviorum TaxID=2739434 RepID=A0A7H9BH21_9NEIS|nr:hypothetical protein [Chitinibacter bivalviorum]QLG87895.1 hypothetical protein HQ393_06265 [Chitinibacter bivalviorum]
MKSLFPHASRWQFSPDPCSAAGRYALLIDDEDLSKAVIDELAQRIHAQADGALGILEAKPVFISNLRVWENIVLPSWYHSGESLADLDLRLQDFLRPFEFDQALFSHNLTLLPAQLDITHRRVAALLRALLQHPKYLILDEEWLVWLQQSRVRQSLLSQVFDYYTGLEYVIVLCSEHAPEGYTPVKLFTEVQGEIASL